MQNLIYPTVPVLITALAATDFGVFTRSINSKKVLMVKKNSKEFEYDSAAVKVSASHTKTGSLQSVLLKTLAPCPCSNCNLEYGISVKKIVKDPGVQNDDYYPKPRYYGNVLNAIQTCVSGFMADSDKLLMENEIIDQITNDYEAGARENGIIYARRFYAVTDDDSSDNSTLDVTMEDGTVVTITASANAAGQLYTAFMANGTVNAKLIAYKYGADAIVITSIDPGYKFTIAEGTDTTIVGRHIWLLSKSLTDQFTVEFKDGWFEKKAFSLYTFSAATATATNFHYAVDGVSGSHTGASEANFYTDLATLGGISNGYYTNPTGTTYHFASYLHDVKIHLDAWYTFTDVNTVASYCTITNSFAANGTGEFPYLTSDDVFREFAHRRHLGGLEKTVYLEQPSEGSKWTKLIIECQVPVGAIHGASHVTAENKIEHIYIQQGRFGTVIWDATDESWESITDNSGFSADATLLKLLRDWGLTAAQVTALHFPVN